jgi:putative oxidoreductase
MEKIMYPVGRVLMAQIFLLAGLQKIAGYAGTQGYMESMGVPGALLPLVILTEVGGSIALIVGWRTRWVAAALALFTLLTAAIFHTNFSDGTQMIMFMKNLSIAGGLLFIAAHGAGACALDTRRV